MFESATQYLVKFVNYSNTSYWIRCYIILQGVNLWWDNCQLDNFWQPWTLFEVLLDTFPFHSRSLLDTILECVQLIISVIQYLSTYHWIKENLCIWLKPLYKVWTKTFLVWWWCGQSWRMNMKLSQDWYRFSPYFYLKLNFHFSIMWSLHMGRIKLEIFRPNHPGSDGIWWLIVQSPLSFPNREKRIRASLT